jgi:hypothetical protein
MELAAQYASQSVRFAQYHLGLDEPGVPEPEAPTVMCGTFADVASGIVPLCDEAQRRQLFGHLKQYMESCVVEHRQKLSGKFPTLDEFYSYRLGTASVEIMLDLVG